MAEAEKLRAELLVIGSHGHSAARDLLLGGISAGVIRKSAIPILVVPA